MISQNLAMGTLVPRVRKNDAPPKPVMTVVQFHGGYFEHIGAVWCPGHENAQLELKLQTRHLSLSTEQCSATLFPKESFRYQALDQQILKVLTWYEQLHEKKKLDGQNCLAIYRCKFRIEDKFIPIGWVFLDEETCDLKILLDAKILANYLAPTLSIGLEPMKTAQVIDLSLDDIGNDECEREVVLDDEHLEDEDEEFETVVEDEEEPCELAS